MLLYSIIYTLHVLLLLPQKNDVQKKGENNDY
jgi:hypothetical protein